MTDSVTTYRQANEPLPESYWLWPLHGRGFENLGLDGRPIEVSMPSYGPDELLMRHDACGICFSNVNPVIDGRQIRFVGSSGSSIADMRAMLVLIEQGVLNTNRSVAAISGLDGVYDGIYAVSQGQFPGKVVVYPHIAGLGLTPLAELRERLPQVYTKLGPGEAWTVAAAAELLRLLLR